MEKILLILDLDETLIHAISQKPDRKYDFQWEHYFVYKRPFLREFLRKCAKDFKLAIWSSAGELYVQEIVKRIIPEEVNLVFVWAQNKCTYAMNLHRILPEDGRYADYSEYIYYKKLKKVRKLGYSLERMLIVDDSPEKVMYNYGNAIYITPFEGASEDKELQHLSKYLDQLKNVQNVRNIEKRGWKHLME